MRVCSCGEMRADAAIGPEDTVVQPYDSVVYLWIDGVWDRGHLPLLLCFTAFVVTFITTRVITRMIRSGRGPFKDNVSASGVHVHHAVPGVFLLVIGAFTAIAVDLDSPFSLVAGLFVGIGTSLVLDEFALILHLEDVYWTDQGRVSVEIAGLAVACLGLMLIGANPLGFLNEERQTASVITIVSTIALHLGFIVLCVLKGKFRMALLGIFLPPVALIGAIRLALPGSRWARRWYSPKRLARAEARAARHAARWEPIMRSAGFGVAGTPADVEPGLASTGSEIPPMVLWMIEGQQRSWASPHHAAR